MKHWDTSCVDWERRIVAGESLIPFGPLFPDQAEEALDIFKSLFMVDLPMVLDQASGELRHPTFGEACDEWVFDFVGAIFGAYDPNTGERLITEFFLLISKKNGKSTIAAAIMLTALILNWRHYGELLILAPTIEIANNSFGPAAAMVRADPKLTDLLHVQDNFRQITHRITHAVLKVVAADTDTVGGKKAGFVLVDELWIFGKRPKSEAMLQEATGGLSSRPEGFTIYLTTQSDEPPAGVFEDRLRRFRAVRDGTIKDKRKLPLIYEFPSALLDAEAYLDPDNFYITNPHLGRAVPQAWIAEKLAEAIEKGGDALRIFLAKHLNVQIGQNLRGDRWPGAEHWEAAVDKGLADLPHWQALDRLLRRSEVAVVGIDGGGLDDLFGLTVLGREPAEIEVEIEVDIEVDGVMTTAFVTRPMKRWLSWSHAWCHRGVLKRRPAIATILEDIAKAGELTILDQPLGDVASIIDRIERIKNMNLLGGVAVDASGLGEMEDALDEIGVTQESGLLVAAPQGGWMMSSIKGAERRLASGLLKHAGGPLMRWCVPNLKIEPTATGIRATKQTAGDAKIDPAMAMFNAVTLMSRNPVAHRVAKPQLLFI
ncbi:Phage terminase, large subunit [Devosia sp. H5989]|nr:Phage terminase, large subunit [Devosia sp. H5989]